LGDVVPAGVAQDRDSGVPQGGHVLWCVAGMDLAAVFVERHVAHPVEPVLDRPMRVCPGRQGLGTRRAGVGGGDEVDASTVFLPLGVAVRRSWATWAAPVNSIHAGASRALIVRVARRSWPVSVVVVAGIWAQGSALSMRNSSRE